MNRKRVHKTHVCGGDKGHKTATYENYQHRQKYTTMPVTGWQALLGLLPQAPLHR